MSDTDLTTVAVKPDATPEEVAAVVNDDNGAGSQLFSQAVSLSNP